MKGQVTLFDLAPEDKTLEEHKYNLTIMPEVPEKELLSMEKEMLGIYISGHPLEKYKEQIKKLVNIDTLKMSKLQETEEGQEDTQNMDGKPVKYAGIITSVKKKYTKNNTIMAFVTVEDLYGSCEIIVFDSCYGRCNNILLDENIVVVEGRLSIREDEAIKIVANSIRELKEDEMIPSENHNINDEKQEIELKEENKKPKLLSLNIESATEEQKTHLRGAIKFFMGDKNNIAVEVIDGGIHKPCGAIFINEEILEQFKEILGAENVELK